MRVLRRALLSDDGKDAIFEVLKGQVTCDSRFGFRDLLQSECPYDDLGRLSAPGSSDHQSIFITGRFRSGSTLLWNIFRNRSDCTAYYEPLNERRWFDPAKRGIGTDSTHKHVDEYWREYDGLDELGEVYQEAWIRHNLYMPATFWAPELKRYIDILIESASGRAVLQFNRVDFRLPWLRAAFPRAKIVHLYRHPRDQWVSTLHGGPHFPLNGRTSEFGRFDKFYLLMWARDLAHQFPFLGGQHDNHPYELFYLLWKLSYLFGKRYAHVSVEFERLVQDPENQLSRLFELLDVAAVVDDSTLKLIERPALGRWHEYADGEWFAEREAKCEQVLSEFFATAVGMPRW